MTATVVLFVQNEMERSRRYYGNVWILVNSHALCFDKDDQAAGLDHLTELIKCNEVVDIVNRRRKYLEPIIDRSLVVGRSSEKKKLGDLTRWDKVDEFRGTHDNYYISIHN